MSAKPVSSLEIERKYEVSMCTGLPSEMQLAEAGFTVLERAEHHLQATYFDTAERLLASRRLAVRTRSGGKDAGWHLKEKTAAGAHELLWEPSAKPPAELLAAVGERLGVPAASVQLLPLAELHTTRTVWTLSADPAAAAFAGAVGVASGHPHMSDGSAGEIELADDRVRAFDPRSGIRRAWREWEAELLGLTSPVLLDRLEPVLFASGARPSLSFAKVARASGQLAAIAEMLGRPADVVAQLRELDLHDQRTAAQQGSAGSAC